MEVYPLKLTDQHFPFPCSISTAVQDAYASAAQAAMEEQSMELAEVLGYLQSIEDFSLGPMDAIRAQTEAIGDPGLPTGVQVAILEWLQDAYTRWETEFPIEEPLAFELRKLLPVAAAVAITDENFLIPGAHSLHRLMDTIHNSAIGWQSQLGRASVALEQLVEKATTTIAAWIRGEGGDLEAICEGIISGANRDQDRARRMAQRLVETEKGRLRSASARWKSAEMVNSCLEMYQATAEIGAFLTGPWYESAQLVLLKFGADSDEWAQMRETTEVLLDSLQIDSSATEERRQHLFDIVTKVPDQVKHWLISLHMDTEAIGDAVGLIEDTHLSLLRQQPIKLEKIQPMPIENAATDNTSNPDMATIESLDTGQWFLIEEGKNKGLRAQLVLKLAQEQQLQFANKAGLKAAQYSYEEFSSLLANGNAKALRSGASFSICLANAGGIETLEDMETVLGIVHPEQIHEPQDEVPAEEEAEEAQAASKLQHPEAEASREEQAANMEPDQVAAPESDSERMQNEQHEAERIRAENDKAERLQKQREQGKRLQAEKDEAQRIQAEIEEAERIQAEKKEAERIQAEREEAQRIQAEREEAQRIQAEKEEAERIRAEKEEAEEVEIHIPMGTWLGFHDGDAPLMAKMAVHDVEHDCFIFVDRQGIKMRSLNKKELIELMDNNQVDILETRSSFRDEVTQIKKGLNK